MESLSYNHHAFIQSLVSICLTKERHLTFRPKKSGLPQYFSQKGSQSFRAEKMAVWWLEAARWRGEFSSWLRQQKLAFCKCKAITVLVSPRWHAWWSGVQSSASVTSTIILGCFRRSMTRSSLSPPLWTARCRAVKFLSSVLFPFILSVSVQVNQLLNTLTVHGRVFLIGTQLLITPHTFVRRSRLPWPAYIAKAGELLVRSSMCCNYDMNASLMFALNDASLKNATLKFASRFKITATPPLG